MRRIILAACLLLAAAMPNRALAQTPEKQASFMLAEWQRAREYTKEYLDAMPEDGYSFRPVPEVRTFAQHYLHLAADNYGFAARGIGKEDPVPDSRVPENDPALQSKAGVTKYVLDSYDYVIAALKSLSEVQMKDKITSPRRTLTREQIFFKCFEHQTHHRGQTTVYLRLKGIKPPDERLF